MAVKDNDQFIFYSIQDVNNMNKRTKINYPFYPHNNQKSKFSFIFLNPTTKIFYHKNFSVKF